MCEKINFLNYAKVCQALVILGKSLLCIPTRFWKRNEIFFVVFCVQNDIHREYDNPKENPGSWEPGSGWKENKQMAWN